MTHKEFKEQIVAGAIAHMEQSIEDLLSEAEMKLSVNPDTEDGIITGSLGSGDLGTEDMSKEAGMIRKAEAQNLKNLVQQFKNYRFEGDIDSAGPLAVVRTNRGTFFISSALPAVTVDGEKVNLISTQAPIYKHLQGKKAGDSFVLNNLKFEIKEVF